MDDTKLQWRRRLDETIELLASQLRTDLYDNVVVPVVEDWFSSWDSLADLNDRIRAKLSEQSGLVERKMRKALGEFESYLKTQLRSISVAGSRGEMDLGGTEDQISARIADIIGVIVTVVGATLAGGTGTALLASGPVGWIIGLVGTTIVFFLGRGVVKDVIESQIRTWSLPPFLKRPAKSKVATELSLNAG